MIKQPPSLWSVSYTHLDVSKRQLLIPLDALIEAYAADYNKVYEDADVDTILEELLADAYGEIDGYAVSYTHLDVYKRQAL